jgi:hypothetical protein
LSSTSEGSILIGSGGGDSFDGYSMSSTVGNYPCVVPTAVWT